MCPEGLISKCYKFNESKVTFKLLHSYATVVWASCQKISLTSGYPQFLFLMTILVLAKYYLILMYLIL
jgi:hypothetical protein